jgi:hypothetical protein
LQQQSSFHCFPGLVAHAPDPRGLAAKSYSASRGPLGTLPGARERITGGPSKNIRETTMSIFSSILGKIFPSSHPAVKDATAGAGATPGASQPSGSPAGPGTASAGAAPNGNASASTAGAPAATQRAAMPEVDVEQVLNGLAQKNPQKLNWRTSIVDLMKLLDLDSSLGARQQLAGELGYTGDKNDSASMNIWLHKQVMSKLAQNGGKVPADLRA